MSSYSAQTFAVYENVLRAGQWSGWSSLGGTGSSAPAAISRRGTNYLDVAVRGTDNSMFLKTFQPGSGWSNWSPLGGGFTNGPALNSQDATVLNVWGRGLDGQLFQRAWNGSAWSDWMPLGGYLTGAPSVISRTESHVDVFVRGAGRDSFQKYWHGGVGWTDWLALDPRALDSTPVAGSDAPGHLVLFARSGGTLLIKEWRDTSGWTAWTDWGPVAPPQPPAPAPTPAPAPRDGLATLRAGLRCTPPGGRLVVKLTIHKRAGMPRAHIRRVVFYVRNGPRRVDRHKPYRARLRLKRKAGTKGRVFARVYYTRVGSKKMRRKTVSRPFVMCG